MPEIYLMSLYYLMAVSAAIIENDIQTHKKCFVIEENVSQHLAPLISIRYKIKFVLPFSNLFFPMRKTQFTNWETNLVSKIYLNIVEQVTFLLSFIIFSFMGWFMHFSARHH